MLVLIRKNTHTTCTNNTIHIELYIGDIFTFDNSRSAVWQESINFSATEIPQFWKQNNIKHVF